MSGKKKSNGLGSGGGKKKKEYKSNEKQPALGEISHISLDSHQEDQLLELFKALDGIQTLALDPAVTLVSEQPWSPSAGCPDSPSSGSDQSVDEELNNAPDDFGAETLTTAPISSALDTPLEKSDVGCVSSSRPIHSAERKLMVRQMIRDDRRKSIDWRECKSTSKQAKKEFARTGVLSPLHVSPSVTRRVRVSVVFNGTAKAYVVERSREGLESIYENCRRDFQLDASRDVVLSSEQSQCRVVSEGDLLSCPDGEVVYLLSESAVSANVCSGDDIGPPDCPDGTKPNMEHGIDPAHCWTPRCVDAAISASLLRNLISPAASNSDRSRDKLLLARKNLPIYAMRNDIVRLIRDNAVVVVVGDTGSG